MKFQPRAPDQSVGDDNRKDTKAYLYRLWWLVRNIWLGQYF